MRGNFLHSSGVVPVETRNSSHRESRKGTPCEKYNVVVTSSSSFPPVHGTGPENPMPEPWDTETPTGSNCGGTTCSLFPLENCRREQVWDHVRSAVLCRAGKQENCQGGGSSPLKHHCFVLLVSYTVMCSWNCFAAPLVSSDT